MPYLMGPLIFFCLTQISFLGIRDSKSREPEGTVPLIWSVKITASTCFRVILSLTVQSVFNRKSLTAWLITFTRHHYSLFWLLISSVLSRLIVGLLVISEGIRCSLFCVQILGLGSPFPILLFYFIFVYLIAFSVRKGLRVYLHFWKS